MNNKEKKKHHFVPQVYLKKFSHSSRVIGEKEHFFISTYDKIRMCENPDDEVEKICFKSKLYTVNSPLIEERESIENLYSETIEADYNKFYNIITNEKITKITTKERRLIILTIINLHLRNLYWFKALNELWADFIKAQHTSHPINIYDEAGDILFPFEDKSLEQILAEDKTSNKQAFIYEHMQLSINLTDSHINDLILVDRNNTGFPFITSDRPVICNDISSSFRLPINKDYMLTILPNSTNEEYDTSNIVRNSSLVKSDIFNILQYENAERIIIGSELKSLQQAKKSYDAMKATSANNTYM
jgi:hypothetical protein